MSDDFMVDSGACRSSENTERDIHCSPDGYPESFPRGADSFSPPADAENSTVQPPPAPPAPFPGDDVPGDDDTDITPVPAKPQGSTALKAVIITLCVLVLLAAFAMIFVGTDGVSIDFSADFGNRPITGTDENDGGNENEYGDFKDYQDFFDSYYSGSVTGVSGIATAAADPGLSLELTGSASNAELSLTDIYKKCAPAVVGIKAGIESTAEYWGTGIIFREDGYIVTNFHIIDGANFASVVLSDETEYEAKLVGYDDDSDIAILKIDASGLAVAEFGDSAELEVGESVVAIGNPLGEQFQGTMTNGIISAIDRSIEHDGHTMTLLQTNAAINEGNSGGPLINMRGQVIGITNMKMISSYSNIEGIGFAIPSRSIKSIVDQLLGQGYVSGRPALGITVGAIPSDAVDEFDIPGGLYISAVEEASDAYAQGVRVGDILTHVNGQEVQTTSDVAAIKDGFSVGDRLTLTIYRDGKSFDVDVALHEKGEIFN